MIRRETLRSATSSQHAALDRVVTKQKDFADLRGYGRWLAAMYRFHRDVSGTLETCGKMGDAPRDAIRLRTSLLIQDLADLGLAMPAYQPEVPNSATWAEALGILYVAEGASLGARQLFVQARKLGLSEIFGARQLGFAAHNLESWRYILRLLESFDCDPEDEMRMIQSAQRTFVVALAHLSQQA